MSQLHSFNSNTNATSATKRMSKRSETNETSKLLRDVHFYGGVLDGHTIQLDPEEHFYQAPNPLTKALYHVREFNGTYVAWPVAWPTYDYNTQIAISDNTIQLSDEPTRPTPTMSAHVVTGYRALRVEESKLTTELTNTPGEDINAVVNALSESLDHGLKRKGALVFTATKRVVRTLTGVEVVVCYGI